MYVAIAFDSIQLSLIVVYYQVENIVTVIVAACTLHNVCIAQNDLLEDELALQEAAERFLPDGAVEDDDSREGARIRDALLVQVVPEQL